MKSSMWYHVAILDIFRPFLCEQNPQHLESFTSDDSSPETVFAASFRQLKQLAVMLRQLEANKFQSMYLNAGILAVMDAVLSNTNESDAKFYFLLCLCMTQDLYHCFPVFAFQFQGFLAMAMQTGLVSAAEAHGLLERFYESGKHHGILQQPVGEARLVCTWQ
jgi:hypothetical protein